MKSRKSSSLPTHSPTERTEVMMAMSRSFSGPLPPPEYLAGYNDAVPGSGDRIFSMAESQQSHRQFIEKRVVDSNISSQNLGTILGFVIVMTAIVGGIYLIAVGKAVGGLVSIITALVSLAGVFIFGKIAQKRNLTEKANTLQARKR